MHVKEPQTRFSGMVSPAIRDVSRAYEQFLSAQRWSFTAQRVIKPAVTGISASRRKIAPPVLPWHDHAGFGRN
jgi:hypothetical protein